MVDKVSVVRYTYSNEKFELLVKPDPAFDYKLGKITEISKILVSDEIYTDLTFKDNYESISTYYPEATFVSGGLSKWCGAGGWRLGFFAVPEKLSNFLDNLKSLASESYSTVNTPSQYAAVEAYKGDYKDYKSKVDSEYDKLIKSKKKKLPLMRT